ncbi:hypothetical protein G647_09138 [Cladophialophora carrionii CBS 160.54]|uniref:Apoptosis regulator Bcl-2 family BH4 domain-containing protein n=1 Tax=Cladophialophora carrionii CBS 160.54 TaxID=1279043 RepID=V9CY60_9EURO|nr:uncharacterized protein G647_09138 [Cladophialophora carrionii CBS 160.54]ETI19306.1 hypothetical protein G647_09138 [Cladophialophora carrionii CBS 160.54]
MFSSFTSFSLPRFGFGRGSGSGSSTAIDIPAVEVHNIETSTDKRDRTLKHLLKLIHTNFSILYNRLRFHNHTPHLLGSAYLLGSPPEHLNDIYEDAARNEGHEPWVDSPSEIALHDYRDFLGRREYQRAWVDFFEDQLVLHGYEWKMVVAKFVFERGPKGSANEEPMFSCLTAGLAHPLIHLGYAYELNSREVAMEALGLAATCYDARLAGLLESGMEPAANPRPAAYSTGSLLEVFARVNGDGRLDGVFDHYGGDNLSKLLGDATLTSILMEHWSAWKISDPTKDFAQSQALAAALLVSSAPSVGGHGWDFFLVHLLTSSHAVRILIPFLDAQYHVQLVREWLLIALAIYIAQLRPLIKTSHITDVDLAGRGWVFVSKQAVEGPYKFDAHFVKACRALYEADKVWGESGPDGEDKYWLKAAVKFAGEFAGWGGFGEEDEQAEEELRTDRAERQKA